MATNSVLGGLGGLLFGGQASEDIGDTGYANFGEATAEQEKRAKEAEQRKAATADLTEANTDLAAARAGRSQMVDAAAMAKQAALGQGPSAAQQLLQRGSDQAIAAQAAAAAGARGNPAAQAAAQRAAMGQMANVQGNTATDMAALRAKEQQAGMDLYAQQTAALTAAASRERGLGLQQGQMGLESELRQRALNDAQQQAAYELQHQQRTAQQQGNIVSEQMKANLRNANASREQEGGENLLSGIASMAGAALLSDTQAKKDKLLQQFELGKTKAPPGTLTRDYKPSKFLPGNAAMDPGQRDAAMQDWMEEKKREEELEAKLQEDRKGKPITPYTWEDLDKKYVQAPAQAIPSGPNVEPTPWETQEQWQSRMKKSNPAAYQGSLNQNPEMFMQSMTPQNNAQQPKELTTSQQFGQALKDWGGKPRYVPSDEEYKSSIEKIQYPQSTKKHSLHHWMSKMEHSK